jgi:NADH-quinone oxidoreductase subunit J
MTTRPELVDIDRGMLPGLAALALFALMAGVFLGATFGTPAGFPTDASVVAGIGNALLGITGGLVTEGFLVAFILIAIALDAALDGALMLAKREEGDRR